MTNTVKKEAKMPFETWIRNTIARTLNLMDIGCVSLHITHINQDAEIKGSGKIVFSVDYTKAYRAIYLKYYSAAVRMYKEDMYKDLEHALIHELMHIYSTPIIKLAQKRYVTQGELSDANEESTELLTLMFLNFIKQFDSDFYNGVKKLNKLTDEKASTRESEAAKEPKAITRNSDQSISKKG